MTREEFLDEWRRQANEYGAGLTRDQRDIAEQAWESATAAEREACAKGIEDLMAGLRGDGEWSVGYIQAAKDIVDGIRARGDK